MHRCMIHGNKSMIQKIQGRLLKFQELLSAFLEFRYIGDPILRIPTEAPSLDEGIQIGKQLGDTLIRYREITGYGRGLAAPQIGISKSVFVTYTNNEVQIYINPKITWVSESFNFYRELCLSSGIISADVKRPDAIIMEWTDDKGNSRQEKAEGTKARLWQHEYGHLVGVCNVDIAEPGSIEFAINDPLQEKLRDSR